MGLEVIGAGFGRTGTESMKRALETIGFGPCYHMYEVLPYQDRVALWRGIAAGDRPDWDAVFRDYRATVDWPAAAFWRELSAHFPEARIILTVRSSESWYASMEKTILKTLRESKDPDTIGRRLIARGVFADNLHDRDHIIGVYERNIAEVQAEFGSDRLLTYELGSGWEPLCRFLECPIPDEAFPSGNATEAFHAAVVELESARKGTSGN